MRIFLLILLFICPQITWSSDKLDALDGKSIICEEIEKPKFPIIGIYGFRFVGSKVAGDYFVVNNDRVNIINFKIDEVSSITIDFITWWDSWKLNRETLILYYNNDYQSQARFLRPLTTYVYHLQKDCHWARSFLEFHAQKSKFSARAFGARVCLVPNCSGGATKRHSFLNASFWRV